MPQLQTAGSAPPGHSLDSGAAALPCSSLLPLLPLPAEETHRAGWAWPSSVILTHIKFHWEDQAAEETLLFCIITQMSQQQLSPCTQGSASLFISPVSRACHAKPRVIILPIKIFHCCIGIFTESHSADMKAECQPKLCTVNSG